MADARTFAARLDAIGRDIPRLTHRSVKARAKQVHAAVTKDTPIDTGKARINWRASLNVPGTRIVNAPSNPASAVGEAIARAARVIDRSKPGQAIHIFNNVPYIGRLNNGSSTQAPAGFIERAMAIAASRFRTRLLSRRASSVVQIPRAIAAIRRRR